MYKQPAGASTDLQRMNICWNRIENIRRETLLARARNHSIQGTSVTKVTTAAKATTITVVTAVNNYASKVTTVTMVTAITKCDTKLTTVTVVTAVTKVIIMTTRTWVNLLIKLTMVNNNW